MVENINKNINISDFRYISKHADPDREYFGSAACRFIALDATHQILHNRDIVLGSEPRYFSHVVSINTEHSYWEISIDFDLLDLNSFEIVAVSVNNDTRIHVKNGEWYDNIDELRGIESIREAKAMYKAVEYIIREIICLYSNRSKKYCKVFAEKYASDFEDK